MNPMQVTPAIRYGTIKAKVCRTVAFHLACFNGRMKEKTSTTCTVMQTAPMLFPSNNINNSLKKKND